MKARFSTCFSFSSDRTLANANLQTRCIRTLIVHNNTWQASELSEKLSTLTTEFKCLSPISVTGTAFAKH